MAKKRLFEVLDEMNLEDTEKGTRLVAVSSNFIDGQTVKGGASISMGVPPETLVNLMSDKSMVILIEIDKQEYLKRNPQ
jgi:hypothetical protein